ncbi:MAG: NAD(P)H-dependent oxidoreductase [Clostridia bacterium]|nr:NAD(P)H-dependent oxidoreductase [Clostridia bacterium]
MLKVLMIVGSLRIESLNRQCAMQIARDLREKASCTFLDYADIPYMNEDIEFPTPEAVARVRSLVAAADGLWFVSPEYNRSYPGLLKNLVDWLSRPVTPNGRRDTCIIWGKKCAVTSVGGGFKGAGCIAEMQKLIPFVGGKLLPETLGIGYTRAEESASILELTEERLSALVGQEKAFLDFLAQG